MNITVFINGNRAAEPTEAWLKSEATGDSRFLSWLHIVKVKDKKKSQEHLAIVQRLSGKWLKGQNREEFKNSQSWRIMSLNAQGKTSEEVFTYSERGSHWLGVKLILLSSQSDYMGYKSDVSAYLPNLFYPVVFPLGTFIIGGFMVSFVIIYRIKLKK
ncbi:hypothetical protein [Paenibacillus sp. NPDC057967]|uniref:hypothetical protein n=1 Tax=Paenibacillus sp. NPDC057967 TaxID=3346293 RepID=UPI0036DA05E5